MKVEKLDPDEIIKIAKNVFIYVYKGANGIIKITTAIFGDSKNHGGWGKEI